jgi:hypothetical protein
MIWRDSSKGHKISRYHQFLGNFFRSSWRGWRRFVEFPNREREGQANRVTAGKGSFVSQLEGGSKMWQRKMKSSGNHRACFLVYGLALMLALIAVGQRSEAGKIGFSYVDKPGNFTLTLVGQAIHPAPITHNIAISGNWVYNGTLTETTGFFSSDMLTYSHTLQHVHAPHGEPPNPMVQSVDSTQAPCCDSATCTGSELVFEATVALYEHPGHDPAHFDNLHSVLTMQVDRRVGLPNDISAYTLIVAGTHRPPCWSTELQASLHGIQVVPPTNTPAFGSALMIYNRDEEGKGFDLALAISGLTLDQVTTTEIHLGEPGVVGPAVFDLGAAADWVEIVSEDGTEVLGLSLIIQNADFPDDFLEELFAGNTYVEIATQTFPFGEIRGQLVPQQ